MSQMNHMSSSASQIPRNLMQTSKAALDSADREKIKRMIGAEISYRHFDDDAAMNFLSRHGVGELTGVLDRFQSLSAGEHKADLFRYFYLYIKGGVYLDMDVYVSGDLNDILGDAEFLSVSSVHVTKSLFQGVLAARAGHPILKRAIMDVLSISNRQLKEDHHLLCRNLLIFTQDYCKENPDHRVRLLQEKRYRKKVAAVHRDDGKLIMRHYWRRDLPPFNPIRRFIYDLTSI